MTFFGRKCRFVKMTLKMLVSRLSESKNEEDEGVLCLVGFCIGARSRGREGKRAVVYGSIVFHANWSVLIVSHKRQIIGSHPSRHPGPAAVIPLPLPNLPEFFWLPLPRCLKGGNDSLSTSLRIVKLDQHGRFVHSAESQTALAGYVAGMQQRA